MTDRLARWWLQLGLVAVILVFIHDPWLDVEGFAFPKELVLGLVAFPLGALVLARTPALPLGRGDLALALFVILGAVSAATVAVSPGMAWRAVALSTEGATLFFAVRALAARGQAGGLLEAVAVASVTLAVLVLLDAAGVLHGLSLPSPAPAATLGHRNYAAHVIVLGLPVLITLLTRAQRRLALVLPLAGLALSAAAIVVGRSRAAWLVGAGLLLAWPVLIALGKVARRPALRRLGLGAAVVLLGILGAVALPSALAWRGASMGDTLSRLVETDQGSGRGRLLQYRNTNELVRAHPLLGVGPGNWFARYPEVAPEGDPSNHPGQLWQTPAFATGDWLGQAAERGVPALLLWVAFLFGLLRRGLARLRAAGSVEALAAPLGLVLLLAALTGLGALDCVIQLVVPVALVFVSLGTLDQPVAPARRLARPLRALVAAALVMIGLAVTWMNLRQVRACLVVAGKQPTPAEWSQAADLAVDQHRLELQAAMAWLAQRDPARARPHALAAHRLSPGNHLAAMLEEQTRGQ